MPKPLEEYNEAL